MTLSKIAVVPAVHGLGGMVSFQGRFIAGLEQRGITVTRDLTDPEVQSALIIGGTKKIGALLSARRRGVRLVQRLNGMNWLHRVQPTPVRAFMRSELNNWLLAFIRRSIVHRIVYQSQFSRWWWDDRFGSLSKPFSVVYNAVDLSVYSPSDTILPPQDQVRILVMEGHMGDFYSSGLQTSIELAIQLHLLAGLPVELVVAGDVPVRLQQQATSGEGTRVTYLGVVPPACVPALTQEVHMLFSADLNAACPNSVVESLACGLPVLAFDTGALKEIVPETAGAVVPYGSNYWKLEKPDIHTLAAAAKLIFEENPLFRAGARQAALAQFGLESMLDGYLAALQPQ
jgi:glycosyltransferase involved in cell wall biosynthesis